MRRIITTLFLMLVLLSPVQATPRIWPPVPVPVKVCSLVCPRIPPTPGKDCRRMCVVIICYKTCPPWQKVCPLVCPVPDKK